MKKIKPGTIVRLRRNGKIIGTVIKVGKFHKNTSILGHNKGMSKYSILWFGSNVVKHDFCRDEIQVVLRSNTIDL